MTGADEIRQRPFAVDVPGGFTGKGRVVLFANNPIYRWQNHGEFNMVFNAILNWNDLAAAPARPATPPAAGGRRGIGGSELEAYPPSERRAPGAPRATRPWRSSSTSTDGDVAAIEDRQPLGFPPSA